ncbi:pectinesterase inhibitor 1-like [Salvia hispanica]|uniref:pectinesterase inhibitor 1-like n=1 Tax=Salvia hispanica TaxID=49212 RepID=UPI0020098509|nr:pectinesterase inhibitor 1-like [Salvia hispanica]
MLRKSFLLLALLFGLVGAARPHVRHGQKLSKLTGDALVEAACHGVGGNEADCISTLQSATPVQKAEPNALAFFTLKFVENHAENITDSIQKLNADSDVDPQLQSALTDCMDQYESIDDLIEDANDGVGTRNYPDAQKFITAALSGAELCSSQLKNSNFEEKKDCEDAETVDMARDLTKYVVLHKQLLSAALNILTID